MFESPRAYQLPCNVLNTAPAPRKRVIDFMRRRVSAEHGSPKTGYCMYPVRGSRMDNAENVLGATKAGATPHRWTSPTILTPISSPAIANAAARPGTGQEHA